MMSRNFEHYSLSGEFMKTLVRRAAFVALSSFMLSPLSLAHASPSQEAPHQIATFTGHTNWVNSVSFPSEGTLLASGSFDNAIRLWDVASKRNIATFRGHRSWVWSVSLSLDGGLLASGSSDGTIRLWDVASRQNIATLTGSSSDRAAVLSVAFSSDGTMLASGSDGAIRLWDVASRQEIATLEGHANWVSSVSFSPDGGLLASGSFDNTIRLWDVASRQEIATLEGHTNWVQSVSFSPDGGLLASGADDNTIRLWDVASRQETATLEGHTNWVNSVSFSPNRGFLASGSSDGTIKLWDVRSRQNIATLEGNTSEVRSVSFSPDEVLLASGLADGTIALWDVSKLTTAVELAGLSTSHDSVREDDESVTIALTVTLDKAAATDETVTLALVSPTQGKSAKRGEDFDATLDETITIVKGQSAGTAQLVLTPKDNTMADGDKALAVEATSSSGHQALIHIKIIDTGVELAGLSSSHDSVREDDESVTIALTVTLDKAAATDETVTLALVSPTEGKTAKRGEDFDATLDETITIAKGQRTGTAQLVLTPKDNTMADGDKALAVEATSSSGHQALIHIEIIDTDVELAGLSTSHDSVREDDGSVTITLTVTLDKAAATDETVTLALVSPTTEGNSAKRNEDFDATLDETITIPKGQRTGTAQLVLTPKDNTMADGDRALAVEATSSSGHQALIPIKIIDDEVELAGLSTSHDSVREDDGSVTITLTVTLDKAAATDETVTLALVSPTTEGKPAKRNEDFDATLDETITIPKGQRTGTAQLVLTPKDNTMADGDRALAVEATSSSGHQALSNIEIIDDEVELAGLSTSHDSVREDDGSVTIALTVTLDRAATTDETVTLALVSPIEGKMARRGEDFDATLDETITIPKGQSTGTAQLVLTPKDNTMADGDRAFAVEATSSSGHQALIPIKIIDTDVELAGLSTSHDSVREDDGSVTIALTVTLDEAAGAGGETVTLALVSPTQGKTAKRGEDFDATLDETITIPKGQRTGTAQLILTPKDNTMADGDRAFAVEATSSSGHQALINIKIIEDEMAGEDDGEADGAADGEEDDGGAADGEADDGEADDGEDDGEADDGEADGEADGEMDFAFAGEVEDQVYTAGTAITALVLPEATGGEGEVTYRVFDLPAGLAFDAATRTISGTPEAATDGAVEVTVLAEDSTGVAATLTFSITVNPPLSFDDFFD